jgi:hypothetical protein
MATTLRDLRDFILRNLAVTGRGDQKTYRQESSFEPLSTRIGSPMDNDEEIAMPSEEKERDAEEENEPLFSKHTVPRNQQSTGRFWFLFTSSITGVLLILVLLFDVSRPGSGKHSPTTTSSITPPRLNLDCGNSLASARANNCTFDLLSYSWTPYPCYERETDLEFREWAHSPARQFGAFPFFIDRNGTMRISNVEAMSFRAGSLAHTTQEEHLGHCIFWMRRIERILEGNGRFTERGMFGDGVPHSLHCSKSLLKRLEEGQNPVDKGELHGVIGIGFNSC